VARHFSEQPSRATGPRRQRRPALSAERLHRNGDGTRGVRACGSCHGRRGEGKGTNPRLAGQHAEYLEAQLLLFREGKRTNDGGVMRAIAAAATRPELQALARYFAELEGP
jgi:cytochrome c553